MATSSSSVNSIRHAVRRLARARGFSLTVILMLALGVGAATTVFSLVEGILLRPLPFSGSGRLVELGEHVGENPGIGITARDIRAYSAGSRAFSSTGAWAGATFVATGRGQPENLHAARLTADVLPTLQVSPLLGRLFTPREEETRAQVALISYHLWTDRYHRDPGVVGSTIDLDRRPYTILGVMPREFEFPLQAGRLNEAELWVPMSLTPQELSEESAGFWGYRMIARLRDGITLGQASADADRVAHEIMRGYSPAMARIHIRGDVRALSEALTGDTRPLLRVLSIAVLVVLVIACANATILMLVRSIRRLREQALRLALGARSGAILRGSVLEGLMLSLTGGSLGLLLAFFAIRVARASLSESVPRIDSASIDPPVALFALAVAILTGVLSSLVPALVALRIDPMAGLRSNASTATGALSHARLRSGLVIVEIGTSLVLLVAALAFLRSYQKMVSLDPGFEPERVLAAGYRLPVEQYPGDARVEEFDRAVIDRLSRQPGVTAVGIGDTLPSAASSGMAAYTIEGQPVAGWKLKFAGFGSIYGDYFAALGIRLIAGRTFTQEDCATCPPVVIVSQSMARHSWPGQNPLGMRMHVGNPLKKMPWATVVGVVADTWIGSRDQKPNDQWYAPALQPAILYGLAPTGDREVASAGSILVRAALPSDQLAQTVRQAVSRIDPWLALDQLRSMHDVVAKTEEPRRIMTSLVGSFSVAALLLALCGIYAVVSFSVTLRSREIAIRMALGAGRAAILRLVLQAGARLALAGSVLGVLGSLAASSLMRALLFAVNPHDPWIYAGGVFVMLAIACLASALPAVRAASIDPTRALRAAS